MKKLLSVILAVILIALPMSIEVCAENDDVFYESGAMPRYNNLDTIGAYIEEGVLGFVGCESFVRTFTTDKTFVITCVLRRRTSATAAWEDYKYKTEKFTGEGFHVVTKSWFAPAGYTYQVYTTLTVKNSAGSIVELAGVGSALIYK